MRIDFYLKKDIIEVLYWCLSFNVLFTISERPVVNKRADEPDEKGFLMVDRRVPTRK